MTSTPAWELPARVLAEFVAQTNRLPRQSGSDTDVEKKAGNILRTFRSKLSSNALDPELHAWLDEHIEGWASDNTRPKARRIRGRRSFAGQALAVGRFRHRYGHLPSAAGSKAREKELGTWLRNHRQAAKGKGTTSWTPSKRRVLDRTVPGWDLPVDVLAASTGRPARREMLLAASI